MNFNQTQIGKIPEDWKLLKLEEVIDIYDSKRVPLSEMERVNRKGEYPYCGANGILDHIDDYIFDGEYLLLAEDGGLYGNYEQSCYLMTGKFWVNNHAHILQAIEAKTSNSFLMYLLNYMDLRPYIVGSTRVKLNQGDLRKIQINFPPLPEQKKIAEILITVDAAIEKVEKAIEKTERLKKGLMQELLTKGIGHKEFKDTEIGKIPKEWEVVRLGDVAHDFISGGTPSTKSPTYWDGSIPWMTSAHINGKSIVSGMRNVTEEGIKNSATNIVPANSILMATRVGIGKIAINLIDIAISQDLTGVILDQKKINVMYAYWLLSSIPIRLMKLSQGSTIKGLLRDAIQRMEISLPDIREQNEIVRILDSIDNQLGILNKKKIKF